MKLEEFCQPNIKIGDYCERYVNDGSPSGFTLHDQLSIKTNPLALEPYFNPLFYVHSNEDKNFQIRSSQYFDTPKNLQRLFIHPDTACKLEIDKQKLKVDNDIRFIPTSSGRTCRVYDGPNYYCKMAIIGTLGRTDRSIPFFKGVAGLENSDEICELLSQNRSAPFSVLPEILLANFSVYPKLDVSSVIRRYKPYPVTLGLNSRIPLFSLWSVDRLNPRDENFIHQLCLQNPTSARNLIFDICVKIVNTYFWLWRNLGFLYEFNAQNVLIEIDASFKLKKLIIRDLNSIEKDVAKRRRVGMKSKFLSGDYKILDSSQDPQTAQVRRSFSFDFKLTEYCVLPLIKAIEKIDSIRAGRILSDVKDVVSDEIKKEDPDFLPASGDWWSHPRVELTTERPYIKNVNAKLRSV